MIRKHSSFRSAVVSVLAMSLLSVACSGPEKKPAGLLSRTLQEVAEKTDRARMKVIEVAARSFDLEYGRPPQSVDELVENGYLRPQDILDAQGNKIALADYDYANEPEQTGGFAGSVVSKSCGACGKGVSSSAKVGDRCPHCGVVWGHETQSYR